MTPLPGPVSGKSQCDRSSDEEGRCSAKGFSADPYESCDTYTDPGQANDNQPNQNIPSHRVQIGFAPLTYPTSPKRENAEDQQRDAANNGQRVRLTTDPDADCSRRRDGRNQVN
jgi:hypothetical protein